jgi:protein-S-isoprenylcysteine O-methyltransferase Ste14
VLAATIALGLGLDWRLLPLPVPFAETAPVELVGVLLVLAGIVLMVWAALEFRRHRTSIRPDRGSDALLLAGPYAFSRNPIYLGEAIAMIGGAIVLNKLWLLLVVPLFVLLVDRLAIRREETYLERRFGAPYVDYLLRVRRWI